MDTPLTKAELLYAIETTFRLDNLAVIPVGDDQVRLDHIPGDSKPPSCHPEATLKPPQGYLVAKR